MAARKTKSIQSLGEKAMAEAKGGNGSPKRKKAAKKSSGGAKKSRKKTSVSKETGKLREAVRVVNEARRLLSEAGCATSANAGRAAKKR